MSIIKFTRTGLNTDLPLPAYATAGAAGFDLRACVSKTTMLYPDTQLMIGTGWRCSLPEGYELQIRPRSGLAIRHRITVANSPGTVDSDYRGELIVCLRNYGTEQFEINRGDRIAQAVLAPVTRATMIESIALDDTVRGIGGFGSTGIA